MERLRVVELSPRAAVEVERARRWWRENRDKAPDALEHDLLDLVARLETIAEQVGAEARNMPGVRRVLLQRIRYFAYFRIDEAAGRVEIAALWHASRRGQPRLR